MKRESIRSPYMKRLTACFLSCVLLLGSMTALSPSARAAHYDDVASSDWFYSAVEYVSGHNYMGASAGNRFQPAVPMTRAGFVEVLYRMAGSPAAAAGASFTDVPSYHPNAKAIAWAVSTGMTSGTGNNQFTPSGTLTRETIATFMDRYVNKFGGGKFTPTVAYKAYNDANKISSWALPSVKTTTSYGIFRGDNYGKFNPRNNISRAECATIVMRVDQTLNPQSTAPAPTPVPAPTPSADTAGASQVETALKNYLRGLGVTTLPTRDPDLDRAAQYAISNSGKTLEQVFSALNINKPLGTASSGQYTSVTYSGAITSMNFTSAGKLIDDMDARYSAPVRTLPTNAGEVAEYTQFGIAVANGKCVIITYDNGGFTSTDVDAQASDYLASQLALPLNSTTEQDAMLVLINAERAKVGAPAVQMLPGLNEAAQIRAEEYLKARELYGKHRRLNGDYWSTVLNDLNIPTETTSGEIATAKLNNSNYPASEAVADFMNSSSHRDQLIRAEYNYVGIAKYMNPSTHDTTWIHIYIKL